MDYPWADSVRQTGVLQVYPDAKISGVWGAIFHQSVAEFNRLSSHHKLGVTLKESKTALVEEGGGADINLSTANGPLAFTYAGVEHPSSVPGNGLHGRTLPVFRQTRVTVVEKAFVFLPQQPRVGAPNGLMRNAGVSVMKIILVHEFIHACGLGDHTTGDVFDGNPTIDGDKMRVGNMTIPPIIISGSTAQRIKDLWAS